MLEKLVDKIYAIRNVSIARVRQPAAGELVDWIPQIRTININLHFLSIMYVTT